MLLTPPSNTTFLISVTLAVLALLEHFVPGVASVIPISSFWLAIIAYFVLFFGNVIRGL